jgi:AcrR family transcriptional regulator
MAAKPKNGNPQTRQAILDALDRVLEERPLDDIGVAEILAEAGLSSRTTYYHHFGSRDEAFLALARHALSEIGQEVLTAIHDPQTRSKARPLRAAVERWMTRASRHHGLTRSMITEWPRIPELKTVYVAFLKQLSDELAAAIDQDRATGKVATVMASDRLATMLLWTAERTIYATMLGARGFSNPAATADTIVAQHLTLLYGDG